MSTDQNAPLIPPEPEKSTKILPPSVQNDIMLLLCTYMLYERAQETPMRGMVEGLITERHSNPVYHHNQDVDWRNCSNQVCVNARLLIDQAKEPEVELNSFAIEMMSKYTINFQPVGDRETRTFHFIKAKLVERGAPSPEPRRIVMP